MMHLQNKLFYFIIFLQYYNNLISKILPPNFNSLVKKYSYKRLPRYNWSFILAPITRVNTTAQALQR